MTLNMFGKVILDDSFLSAKRLYDNNRINCSSLDEAINSISFLPNNGTRLDMEKIKANALDLIGADTTETKRAVFDFIHNINVKSKILDDTCIFFDDIYIECAIKMKFSDILEFLPDFFQTPGHKFIFDVNLRWLIYITWESSIYFIDLRQFVL